MDNDHVGVLQELPGVPGVLEVLVDHLVDQKVDQKVDQRVDQQVDPKEVHWVPGTLQDKGTGDIGEAGARHKDHREVEVHAKT